jgi:hypothetical protein
MDMIMLGIVEGLEQVIAELETRIRATDEDDDMGTLAYQCGSRDAYKTVLDKIREICL